MTSLTAQHPSPLLPKQVKTTSTQEPPLQPRLSSPISPTTRRPTQTPSSAHPIAPQPPYGGNSLALGFGGIRPPQNTPAENLVPISASRIQGARRLIGGAGKGGTVGGRGSLSHPITPGNTPSSLERITRRIAGNLLINEEAKEPQGHLAQNRIAPSYE